MANQEDFNVSIEGNDIRVTRVFDDKLGVISFFNDKTFNFYQSLSFSSTVQTDFLQGVLNKDQSQKLITCQLAWPDEEWKEIIDEHACTLAVEVNKKLSRRIKHMILPKRGGNKNYKPPSFLYHLSMEKLGHLQNIEAWEFYCYWFSEDLKHMLATFNLDSLDIYSLEGLINDFNHETQNGLIRTEETKLHENLLKPRPLNKEEIIEIEKNIILSRKEGKQRLTTQQSLLMQMTSTIDLVERSHAELADVNIKANLLSRLIAVDLQVEGSELPLDHWLLYFFFLNHKMGITVWLTSPKEEERAKFGFLTMLAGVLLERLIGLKDIYEALKNPQSPRFVLIVEKYRELISLLSESLDPFWNRRMG